MRRGGTRRPAWIIAVLSAAALVVGVVALAKRIEAWHEANPKPLFYAIRTDRLEFTHNGRPVRFTPDVNDEGEGTLTMAYGEGENAEVRVFDVITPEPFPLPGLDRFVDWFNVYFFAENVDREDLDTFRRRVNDGELPLRCVAVVRRVDPGVPEDSAFDLAVDEDDWGWGEVMRHRWSFEFYELMPPGGIAEHTLRMPESGMRFYRRRVRAQRNGEPMPERAPDELREGTWEWDIALRTMPRPPAITKENQALLAAGWTLPVTSLAAIALIVSVAFAVAPARTKAAHEDLSP